MPIFSAARRALFLSSFPLSLSWKNQREALRKEAYKLIPSQRLAEYPTTGIFVCVLFTHSAPIIL